MYLVIDGVKLSENNPINEARLVRHGVVCQSLIELYLRHEKEEVESFMRTLMATGLIC